MSTQLDILAALQQMAATVHAKMSQLMAGEPEDQLRGPFETFMAAAASALKWNVVCTGETALPGRLGIPDYAVHLNKLLAGYAELKAPGLGADTKRFTGHNRQQWRRFSAVPNILYTDGNQWALYRSGELVGEIVRLSGDIATKGKQAVTVKDAELLERLLRDFFSWEPFLPTDGDGKIDLKSFAILLAPLCRMLRNDVTDALSDPASPLVQLARDWRQLLFPEASDEQFADAYAQTVTFALLLGRSEGADPLTLNAAEAALAAQHSLLSRALQVLTDPRASAAMSASLDLLVRVIAVVPPHTLAAPEDPWLYFYEDFLAAYDPKLRKDAGAYYTPVEVVHAQVRLVEDVLVNGMAKPSGFADPNVVTLDPAVGTGTYLLGVIEHALNRIEAEQGAGAVPGQATRLASNLYGFELMVGSYAVTELRVSRALRDRGAMLPAQGARVYLTDTLESPHAEPPQLPLFLQPIADQHAKAIEVKATVPVMVCLGNPPYDRTEGVDANNKSMTGGWVRGGDDGKGTGAIFKDFLEPVLAAGHGVRAHNLYNLYVYFWRWALWKVFEHDTAKGPGVVSFISASSYLDGDAFLGMREHMRRVCDEIWILDLGGEGRGPRRSENVFAIQTPVAIAVAVRYGKGQENIPATVHTTRIDGTREEKLKALDAIGGFASLAWEDCDTEWRATFRPVGSGVFFDWPLLTDVFPWQQVGLKAGRTWVIAPDVITLERRWEVLCAAEPQQRHLLFKNSSTGRNVTDAPHQLLPLGGEKLRPVTELSKDATPPAIVPYAFRSFDRQHVFADARLLDRPGPALWGAHSETQLYLTTILNQPLGQGPALTVAAEIPDLHYFRGSFGAKEVIPLYRDRAGKEPNILPGLTDLLGHAYGQEVTPEDFMAYAYGALAQPAFTTLYANELERRELRLPITKDAALFRKIRDFGARLLWLHTYGQRFVPAGKQRGVVPPGSAKCVSPVSGASEDYPESFLYDAATQTLRVGDGAFRPVEQQLLEYEVSGLKVVRSWLAHRLKKGAGRKSSPLDDVRPHHWTAQFTTELLELLWVLEATVAGYAEQRKSLEAVVSGPCFKVHDLPTVPDWLRKPPLYRSTLPLST